MFELVAGLVVGALLAGGLLIFGFQMGWKLRDRAGSIAGEKHIGDVVQAPLPDPIVLNGFESIEPEKDEQ